MSTEITNLGEIIVANAERVDRTTNEAVDVGFFGIRLHRDSDVTPEELAQAIKDATTESFPLDSFRGRAVGYPDLGVWLDDQGLALALVGLGSILGLWTVILPRDTGVTSAAVEAQMLNMGFIMIEAGPTSPLFA